MCGFFSVSNTKKKITYSKEKLDNAANLLKHRGPDKKKLFIIQICIANFLD
tara:strand:+ start:558 stop:710 length:153 start_codon:yes stop_codon:yes gene_type:complete